MTIPKRIEMPTRLQLASMMRFVVACAIVFLPDLGRSATLISTAFLAKDFSSIQLDEIQSSTIVIGEHSRLTKLAAVGPIERIDLSANRIVVAGQSIDMTALNIDNYKPGDLVAIGGIVSTSGIAEATIELVPAPYIYGSTLSYVEGFVTTSDSSTATAKIGDLIINFSMALSKSLGSASDVAQNSYVRVVGIQVSNQQIIGADLQVLPLDYRQSKAQDASATEATRTIYVASRGTKGIIGSDRSTKAIIGGDRSTKAIIGGDRSAKAIIGGDRSAKTTASAQRSVN